MLGKKSTTGITLVMLFITFSAVSLDAQAPKPIKLGSLTVTGNIRTRVEAWDWFKDGAAENKYAFSGSLLRLSIGQQTTKFDWQAEIAAPVLLGLPGNAVAPGAQGQLGLGATYFVANDRSQHTTMAFVKQGYLRFKGLGGKEAHSVRLGRFEFLDGSETTPKDASLAALKRDRISQRLVGNFGFTHVGRSLDGVNYVYNVAKLNFTAVAARPTRGVFQVDGWGGLDIGLFSAALTGPVTLKSSAGEWRVFALQYSDWRDVLKTDNRATTLRQADRGNIRVTTLGANYIHNFNAKPGKFDLLFWGVWQGGRWGSLDHRAGAVALEAGYQPNIKVLKPWIRAGYNYGSGDGKPGDKEHNTFFQILPTPRLYARFPFFNMMNNKDLFGELILRPHAKLSIRTDIHSLQLADRNDLWYSGGGAFQPWTFGYTGRTSNGHRDLATMFDVSADVNVNAYVTITGYFAAAQGDTLTKSIYPNGKNARFGYIELGYRF